MGYSEKFLIKSFHNGVHMYDALMQEWDDRLKFGTTNLLERYRAGKLGLHLHMGICGVERIQTCAVFKHIPGSGLQDLIPIFSIREENPAFVPDPEVYGNDSMLVG